MTPKSRQAAAEQLIDPRTALTSLLKHREVRTRRSSWHRVGVSEYPADSEALEGHAAGAALKKETLAALRRDDCVL